MDHQQLVYAFNEWMRRYIENPEKFEAEFRTVAEFLNSKMQGREPSYGEECVAYMESLVGETHAAV